MYKERNGGSEIVITGIYLIIMEDDFIVFSSLMKWKTKSLVFV